MIAHVQPCLVRKIPGLIGSSTSDLAIMRSLREALIEISSSRTYRWMEAGFPVPNLFGLSFYGDLGELVNAALPILRGARSPNFF